MKMKKYRVYIETAWAETFEALDEDEAKSKAKVLWAKDWRIPQDKQTDNAIKAYAIIKIMEVI